MPIGPFSGPIGDPSFTGPHLPAVPVSIESPLTDSNRRPVQHSRESDATKLGVESHAVARPWAVVVVFPQCSRGSARSTCAKQQLEHVIAFCSVASYGLAAFASMSPFSIEVATQPPLASS